MAGPRKKEVSLEEQLLDLAVPSLLASKSAFKKGVTASSAVAEEGDDDEGAAEQHDDAEDEDHPPEPLTPEDESFIGKLKEIWDPHDSKSLPLRHQMGLLIIEHWNVLEKDPTRRQSVLKEASARLGMSASDVSRLRTFAALFPDFDDFAKRHPEANTWSKVKPLLTKRKPEEPSAGDHKLKKTTEKQREAAIKKYQEASAELVKVEQDLSIKQVATIEEITENILNRIADLAAPLKKVSKAQEG